MNRFNSDNRRREGQIVEPFSVQTLSHGRLTLPGSNWTHLQFRRFAGCPVCNLHLHSFVKAHSNLVDESITTVAFFHSPESTMRPYQGDLPFACVADPDRVHYRAFGVEQSWRAVLNVGVVGAGLRGLVGARSNPFAGGLDQTGLPADFLIDPHGILRALHYGSHANDQWSVGELIQKVRTMHGSA